MLKSKLKTEYAIRRKFEAFFTGRRVEVTNNGEYMLCQCSDAVSFVNINSGEVLSKILLDEEEATCISLSPNNTSFVIALKSSSIQHYEYKDPLTGPTLVRSFKSYHQGPILCMAWDSTSTLLATGSSDGSARIWDVHQKYCTHSLKGATGVFSLLVFDVLKDRPWIFGASGINIQLWVLEAGSSKLLATLENHNSPITGMQLCPTRDKLVSCGLDRVIILWDLDTFLPIKVIPILESLSGLILKPLDLNFFNFGPDDSKEIQHIYAMVVGDKGIPSLWEVDTGKEVWKASEALVSHTDQEGVTLINQITLVPSLQSILFTTYDNSILFAKYKSMHVWKQLSGFNQEIIDVSFIGEQDSHLAVATNSHELRIYNCASMDVKLVKGHNGIVMALSRHPVHFDVFASSSSDNTARVWKLLEDGSAHCIAIATGHTHNVGSLALAHDYMVTGSKDTCIKKWTFPKNFFDKSTQKDAGCVSLVSSCTEKAHSKDVNSVCVSRNSKFVATGSQDKTGKVYDGNDLSLLGSLTGHKRGIWCVQFSPVDQIVATASADGTIKIWTLSDFANAMTLEGHMVSVLRVHFVTNGLQLVSTGADGLLKLWTLKGGVCANTFDGHDGKTWALSTAGLDGGCGSGGRLVTGGEDATLVWWGDVTEEDKNKKIEEQEKLTSQEQTLLNLIHQKKWTKAFKIAIALSQPYRALNITKQILDECPDHFPQLLRRLKEHEVSSLLEFVVQWNTKAKDVREAQAVLSFLLSEKTPSELEQINGFGKALDGLLPYTQRHFKRIDALHQASYIVDYIIQCGNVVQLSNEVENIKIENEEIALLKSIDSLSSAKTQHKKDQQSINDKSSDRSNKKSTSSEESSGSEGEESMQIEEQQSFKAKSSKKSSTTNKSTKSGNKSSSSEESDESETEESMNIDGQQSFKDISRNKSTSLEESETEDSDESLSVDANVVVGMKSVDDLGGNFELEDIETDSDDGEHL